MDEAGVAATKGVNVRHHASGPMDYSEVVAEQFLCPASDNVNLAVVVQNFLHGAAIADPVKHGAPEIFLVFGNTPSATSGFAHKGVEVSFLLGTFPGIEANREEASAFECKIEFTDAVVGKALGGGNGSRAVGRQGSVSR